MYIHGESQADGSLSLDEATSALDATSRVIVFENIKKWRKNRTTIVITHDLSQIQPEDFVYVMKDGSIVEQGFRSDLSRQIASYGRRPGVFASMAAEQSIEPLPPKLEDDWHPAAEVEEILEIDDPSGQIMEDGSSKIRPHTPSFQVGARPGSMMYLDLLEDYARGSRYSLGGGGDIRASKRLSASPSIQSFRPQPDTSEARRRESRPLSLAQKRLSWSPQDLEQESGRPRSIVDRAYGVNSSRPASRMSRQISYDSARASLRQSSSFERNSTLQVPFTYGSPDKGDRHAITSLAYRKDQTLSQNLEDELKGSRLSVVTTPPPVGVSETPPGKVLGVTALFRKYLPMMPQKYMLAIGILSAVGHGIITPIWSSYISLLMTLVGNGGVDRASITINGLKLLALSLGGALASTIQYWAMERVSAQWTTSLRQRAFNKVLQQDKEFFDRSENSPERLVQILVKDADDMRPLVANVIGKFIVVISMIGLGIVWALIQGWRLTLLGLACGPFFVGVLLFNTVVLGRYEILNKGKREALGRTFYEVSPFLIFD